MEIYQVGSGDPIHNGVSFGNSIICSTKKSINIMFGMIPLIQDMLLHASQIGKISIMQSILVKMILTNSKYSNKFSSGTLPWAAICSNKLLR